MWKRLDKSWEHSNCTKSTKIRAWDAVIKSKLLYGLESLHLIQSTRDELDVFQMKGLRQIRKMETTWAQKKKQGKHMSNTHDEIIRAAEIELNREKLKTLAKETKIKSLLKHSKLRFGSE